MRRIIFAISICIFSALMAEVKVEKVLETKSTEEYNKWVAKNRNRLPCLKPILVDVEPYLIKSPEDTVNIEHKIYYYSESGKLLKKEIIKERDVYFGIPKTLDRIFIVKSRYKEGVKYREVRNALGEIILTPQNTLIYIGLGKYIDAPDGEAFPPPFGSQARIYDEQGNEIGIIKNLGAIDPGQLYTPCDERYIVSRSFIGNECSIVCINKEGKMIWRKNFEPSANYLYISANGERIVVHHGNHVTVLNEDGSLINDFTPFNQERVLKCGISPHGGFLVVSNISKHPKIIFYDVSTGKALWCDDSTLLKNKDLIKYLYIDVNNRVIALCESHNLYIFDKNGNLEYTMNLNLGKEWHSVPAYRKDGIVYSKKVEEIARTWFSELSGQYLIITQGRGSINDIYRKVERRIVYRIVETK